MMRHKKAALLSAVAVALIAISVTLWAVCWRGSVSCVESGHGYFDMIPDCWQKISTARYGEDIMESYQCGLRDDFFGNGSTVTITNYHHGHVGIFCETNASGEWVRTPIDYMYDPANDNGYPVKGIFSYDLDMDGDPEIFTAADQVIYTPANLSNVSRRNWAGTTYIDLNEGADPVIQILVWGKWAENITGKGPVLYPQVIDPRFRKPSNTKPDLLLNTVDTSGEHCIARMFVLEQPEAGFASVNYTFDGNGSIGKFPYEEEPFYVKHLYLESGGMIRELIWSAMDYEGMDGVTFEGHPMDVNGDGLLDLIIGGTYYVGDDFGLSRISVYIRKPSLTYPYLFELSYTQTFPKSHMWGFAGLAECDGNSSNGKESAVFLFWNKAISSQVASPSGLLVLKNLPTGYRTEFIEIPSGTLYPYTGVYSHAVVYDWNGDGYDDIVQWLSIQPPDGGINGYGDVVLWLNTGDYNGSSFVYDQTHARVLMQRQSVTWGLSAVQLDDDATPEVSVCTVVRDHYWCPNIEGARYAYAIDVVDWLSAQRTLIGDAMEVEK